MSKKSTIEKNEWMKEFFATFLVESAGDQMKAVTQSWERHFDELFLRKYKSYWQVESKNRLDARTRAFKEAFHEADGFKGCIPGECLYSQDVGFFRRTIRIYQID